MSLIQCLFILLIILHDTNFVDYQLPIYFIVSLDCYGLLMVGLGLMHFPTCPQEVILLQQVLGIKILITRFKVVVL